MSSVSELWIIVGVGRGRFLQARLALVGRLAWSFDGIGVLLGHSNGLRFVFPELHADATVGGRDAQVLVAETTDQVEGLVRWLLLRQPQRIALDVALDGFTHLRCGVEEPVGWNQSANALVWPLEIVCLHVQAQPPLAIGEVREYRPA
jgi:hypothetical protein